MKNQDIKAYFANHENATAFHFTTDEFCFHTEQDAISNTKSLADKKVTTITREEAEALPAKGNYDLSTQVEPIVEDDSFTAAGDNAGTLPKLTAKQAKAEAAKAEAAKAEAAKAEAAKAETPSAEATTGEATSSAEEVNK